MTSSQDPVTREYNNLARKYDRRWSFYVDATISRTKQRLELQSGETLLDVGCGTGVLLDSLSQTVPDVSLYGMDASLAMLAVARKRLGDRAVLRQGSADTLPFADHMFDAVVSSNALHFFRYPLSALLEMSRVLQSGGRIVITDWCDDYITCWLCDKWLRLFDRAHYKTYGKKEIRRLVQRAGFTDIQIDQYKINWFWGMMTVSARNPPENSE